MAKTELATLDVEGLRRFQSLQADAVSAVTERFGPLGWESCRDDLAFHLEFLSPVLEFGLLQPMVDYLCWRASVLSARAIPVHHLALSLDWLGEFFAGHMAAADATVVLAALQSVRTQFLEMGKAPVMTPTPPEPWPQASLMEMALLAGHQRDALAILNTSLDAGHGLVEFELHVIQPALYQIGEKWQANQISVAQEHLASAIVQSLMSVGLLRSQAAPPNDKKILLACVEDNNHAIGLRMVADSFQLAGWDVQYLGANVPTPSLVAQVAAWEPDLVGLSVSFAQQVRVAKRVITQLHAYFGLARPAVMIGGLAINRFMPLTEAVGADAFSADAQSAVHEAGRIIAASASRGSHDAIHD